MHGVYRRRRYRDVADDWDARCAHARVAKIQEPVADIADACGARVNDDDIALARAGGRDQVIPRGRDPHGVRRRECATKLGQ